jgi:integrase
MKENTINKLSFLETQMKVEGKTPEAIYRYKWVINKFSDFVGKEINSYSALRFLEHLQSKGNSAAYLNFVHYVLKRWFAINDVKFDLKPTRVKITDQYRPILTAKEVENLITKARKVCNDQELARLAVSTTYGLRRSENSKIDQGHIDSRNNTITIFPVKEGETRRHLIPKAIRTFIYSYRWNPCQLRWASKLFKNIIKKCKLPYYDVGYHLIRRSLVTELYKVTELKEKEIHNFMRWKPLKSGRYEMLERYAEIDDTATDEKIFDYHPYLFFWE